VAVKQRRELDNPRDDELCSVLAVNKWMSVSFCELQGIK
jgi:hypothetical protein